MTEKKGIKDIHRVVMSMYQVFVEICDKHDLEYYAMDGTLLGAVRHGGFIPWDDDMDVCMPRASYEAFLQIVSSELPDNMYHDNFRLHDKDDKDLRFLTRIYCKDLQVVIESQRYKRTIDMWFDIFPIDGMPKNSLTATFYRYRLLYLKALAKMSQPDHIGTHVKRSRLEKVLIKMSYLLPFHKLNTKKIYTKVEKLLMKYPFESADEIVIFYSDYKFRESVPKKAYEPAVLLPFEDTNIKAPREYKMILTKLYGDYMTPPPVDERNKHMTTVVEKV